MNRLDKFLLSNQLRERVANQTYLYFLNLIYSVLNLMPGIIRNSCFGKMCKVGHNVFFDYNVYIKFPWLIEIGDNVSINRGVEFYSDYVRKEKIIIGSGVYIGPHVRFYAATHDTLDLSKHYGKEIKVGNNVWIGAESIILGGVTIGEKSIIGAGSLITKDIPPNTVVKQKRD